MVDGLVFSSATGVDDRVCEIASCSALGLPCGGSTASWSS